MFVHDNVGKTSSLTLDLIVICIKGVSIASYDPFLHTSNPITLYI